MDNIYIIITGDSPEEEYCIKVEEEGAEESGQKKATNEISIGEESEEEIIVDETEEVEGITVGFVETRCPFCVRWFPEAELMVHLKNHLGVEECWCILCERYYQPGYFKKHLKRHFSRRFCTFDAYGRKVWDDLDATGQKNGRKAKPKACKCCEREKRKRAQWFLTKKSHKLPDPSLWDTPICIDPLDGFLC